jgi:hypothetical protein
MKFNPLTEEELQTTALVPDGIYAYQVIKSEDKISQTGNEYTSLTLKIWDVQGKEHLIFTNLALVKLLKHFCDVNNMQDLYQSGDVPADRCLNKSGGIVQIGTQEAKPDGRGGMYPAKNIVKDYVFENASSKLNPIPPVKNNFDDDALPF